MSDDSRDPHAVRHERFRAGLGQRAGLINERWIELRLVRWSRAGVDQLRGWVRDLAEHSTEFGYPALGDLARELQHRLDGIIGDYPPFKELMAGVTAALERVKLQVDRVQAMGPSELPSAPSTTPETVARKPLAWVAEPDPELASMIAQLLQSDGLEVQIAADADALRGALSGPRAELLLVDLGLLVQLGGDLARADGRPRFGELHWILLADAVDSALRADAGRAGASAVLDKPVDLPALQFAVRRSGAAPALAPLRIAVFAESPDMAKLHAEAMQEAGLQAPVVAADDNLAPLTRTEVDAVLFDRNADPRRRDQVLGELAETPGLAALPVLCLHPQRAVPDVVQPRVFAKTAPITKAALIQALRSIVLANQRDLERLETHWQRRAEPGALRRDQLRQRLDAAIRAEDAGTARPAALLLELDQPAALLRTRGLAGLRDEQARLARALAGCLGEDDVYCRHGSHALLALLAGRDVEAKRDFLAGLANQLESPSSPGNANARVALLPLHANLAGAGDAEQRLASALRNARAQGSHRYLLLETASPKPVAALPTVSALPLEQLLLEVKPLKDAAGKPQALHDASIALRPLEGRLQTMSELIAEVVAKDLATQLDLWEMHAAADYLLALPESVRGAEIAMRLSTASRESAMLVPVVKSIVAKLPPGRSFRLVFEVAESWLVEHNATAVEMVEALRGLGCGVMLGDFGGTDNPRNLGWASWFDYARLSSRRMDHVTVKDDRRAALEKLVRTASSRGARIIAGPVGKVGRAALVDWGVAYFE